eukprot:scaffold6594_cov162-Amphora_coffeaeformis.AAC.4
MVRHAKDRKRRSGRSTTKLKVSMHMHVSLDDENIVLSSSNFFTVHRTHIIIQTFFLTLHAQNRSWVRWDPKPKIKDPIVKQHWDPSKSPAANLADMGLVARFQVKDDKTTQKETATAPKKAHVIELFDVPDSDRPSRQTRFPLTKEEEEYMAKCMAKHGDNYKAMFRDIKINNMQHTEDKLRKMGARFLLLNETQRRVPVPSKVEPLLPDGESSSEDEE